MPGGHLDLIKTFGHVVNANRYLRGVNFAIRQAAILFVIYIDGILNRFIGKEKRLISLHDIKRDQWRLVTHFQFQRSHIAGPFVVANGKRSPIQTGFIKN